MSNQPAADDFALAEGATPLAAVIEAEIAAAGPITFARFMELALGHPEHGYYARPGLAWGRDGDYETSPEVHPIFGYLWARQVAECWERLGSPAAFDLVEPGAGSGVFASAMLDWLRARAPDCHAAARVTLLDGHAARGEEQQATLAARGHEARTALLADWLAEPEPIEGVAISNELFDAFPVHLVERRGKELREWYVTSEGGSLRLELGASDPAIAAHFARLGVEPGEGCRAEVSLAAIEAMRALASRFRRGYLLTIDYGYEAERLYAPWRRMGTLMAFRNHSPQPDPLVQPGLTDLTAHVDLTSLAAAAAAAGFDSAPSVSQSEALIALGIGEQLESARERASGDLAAYTTARRAADTLLDPAGLGRVRVLVQAKGVSPDGLLCLRGVG
ncbi:MAG: SAM-dependent methyltransferase [Chloroflexi bacterium]|nr:SAM-dependent methyltransferase [Chloroflexota bacterium]